MEADNTTEAKHGHARVSLRKPVDRRVGGRKNAGEHAGADVFRARIGSMNMLLMRCSDAVSLLVSL
jgi:hypothetical protein